MPASPRKPEGGGESPRRRRRSGGEREPGYLERPPGYEKRRPIPDPPGVHREIIARHEGGGEEPTPERFARAREQWQKLPGVVRQPPAELRGGKREEAGRSAEPSTGKREEEAGQ
jgi:hypothetical protein